jgi:hypothetical protein
MKGRAGKGSELDAGLWRIDPALKRPAPDRRQLSLDL